MKKQMITEEMEVHKKWFEEAKMQTIDSLPNFLKKLSDNYIHDYGTICHAIVSAAIGAAWAMDKTDNGGITGFQAGCIMWGFIKQWNYSHNKLGLRLLDYDNILYPQYEDKFKNEITLEHWERIQEEAKNKLKENDHASTNVRNHWISISEGNLPFNFRLKEKE
jgi:hypothetical protein